MIGVPVDGGDDDDRVAVTVSATTLLTNNRDVLANLGLGGVVSAGSVGAIIGADVDVLTEFDIPVVIAVAIALERVSLEDPLSFCFC